MANLKRWVLDATDGEEIIGLVIGNMGWQDYGLEDLPEFAQNKENWNKVLPWDKAESLLDYTFNDGYGAPGCQAITVWTATKVIFVTCYDGATSIASIPRNPEDHIPAMYGGG